MKLLYLERAKMRAAYTIDTSFINLYHQYNFSRYVCVFGAQSCGGTRVCVCVCVLVNTNSEKSSQV